MDIVYIGKILRPYGMSGMVVVKCFAGIPRNLNPGVKVRIYSEDDEYSQLTVHSVQPHNKIYRVSFRGITTRAQAEQLAKKHICIPQESMAVLPENEFYVCDLVGCAVRTVIGEQQGTVDDVLNNPGNDLLKVVMNNDFFYVPMVKEIVKSIDISKREIIIEPIEGLIAFE